MGNRTSKRFTDVQPLAALAWLEAACEAQGARVIESGAEIDDASGTYELSVTIEIKGQRFALVMRADGQAGRQDDAS